MTSTAKSDHVLLWGKRKLVQAQSAIGNATGDRTRRPHHHRKRRHPNRPRTSLWPLEFGHGTPRSASPAAFGTTVI